jgi:hypothetical protein
LTIQTDHEIASQMKSGLGSNPASDAQLVKTEHEITIEAQVKTDNEITIETHRTI